MEPFVLKEKEYFLIQDWVNTNPNLTAGFTSKNNGNSLEDYTSLNVGFHVGDHYEHVCENRRNLSEKLNFPINQWVGAEQTHEIHIQKITREDQGKGSIQYGDGFRGTDGFYTFEKNILLTLCFADCVPLYFFEPKSGAIGIAHAGWKGSVNGIAEEMILALKDENIAPSDIFVAIGPSICENCYIVDNRVIDLVQNRLEDVEEKPYNLIKDNQYHLNLQKLNKLILLKSGVAEEHIKITNLCTSCHSKHFFSHRRDNGNTGRMMSFIGWKEG